MIAALLAVVAVYALGFFVTLALAGWADADFWPSVFFAAFWPVTLPLLLVAFGAALGFVAVVRALERRGLV